MKSWKIGLSIRKTIQKFGQDQSAKRRPRIWKLGIIDVGFLYQ